MRSHLDAVNVECRASDYEHPELERNGYRFFFRGYVASLENTKLVGFCLASPIGEPRKGPHYVSVCGSGIVKEYQPGEKICDPSDVSTEGGSEGNMDDLVEEKDKAMKRLTEFVAEKACLTHAL